MISCFASNFLDTSVYPCLQPAFPQDEGQDEGEVITDEIVAVKKEIGDEIADEIEDEVGKEIEDEVGKEIEDEVGKEVDNPKREKDDVEKQGGAKRQKCGCLVDRHPF